MKTLLYFPTAILLVCMLAFTTSCDKEDVEPELVPITTTGENTMGFYVDGEPVKIEGEYNSASFNPHGVNGAITTDNIIYLHGSGGKPRFSIVIYVPFDSLNESNEFLLNSSIWHKDEVVLIDDSPLGGNLYTTDSNHTGKITFTRIENNLASGTFYFDAINKATDEVIEITEGRFDIKFY